VKNIVYS